MNPTIIGIFTNPTDAHDAVEELKALGVDDIHVVEADDKTQVNVNFSEVTGVRNVFDKRNAQEIREVTNREA